MFGGVGVVELVVVSAVTVGDGVAVTPILKDINRIYKQLFNSQM